MVAGFHRACPSTSLNKVIKKFIYFYMSAISVSMMTSLLSDGRIQASDDPASGHGSPETPYPDPPFLPGIDPVLICLAAAVI